MTFSPVRQTSIHGRRVGLTSTGALYVQDRAGNMYAGVVSSSAGKMINPGFVATSVASSAASTLANAGFQHINGAAAVTAFEIAAPEVGVPLDIYLDTSSTLLTFGGVTTDIVFASTRESAAASTLVAARTGGLAGTVISLMGLSTARWVITGSTATLSVG